MGDTRTILNAIEDLKLFLARRLDDLQRVELSGPNSAARQTQAGGQEEGAHLWDHRYGIDPAYRHRGTPSYFDDTQNTDEWQREVYEFARKMMEGLDLRTIYDLGCGSGFKLVKYLGEYDITGADVRETVAFLTQKYPARRWVVSDFDVRESIRPDLLICSDVIEHVPDPDRLIEFIRGLEPRFVLFSTPDRDLVYPSGSPHRLGPPANSTHLREWNFTEFGGYLSRFFYILKHSISNSRQCTQMVFGIVKDE